MFAVKQQQQNHTFWITAFEQVSCIINIIKIKLIQKKGKKRHLNIVKKLTLKCVHLFSNSKKRLRNIQISSKLITY